MKKYLRDIFKAKYDRQKWREVLVRILGTDNINYSLNPKEYPLTESQQKTASKILNIGTIKTADNRELPLFEVNLLPNIIIERNRVSVNNIVKNRLLKDARNGAIAVFHYPGSDKSEWRFSFIAPGGKSSYFDDLEAPATNPKRYTYVFGIPDEEHRTAADRFSFLAESEKTLDDFFKAFDVEKLSKQFFDNYKVHYESFINYLEKSNFKSSVFNGNEKEIRDFVKKLLGRIVFLYFIQKKGWLGASSIDYKDGNRNFLQNFYEKAGSGESFYSCWLTKLFFDTLNNQNRDEDNFEMPDGKSVKIPYLNGGLFEKDSDNYRLLSFPPSLFNELFEFFNQYNFTIYEDSPEDHTIAVDPEMLGHIFENLLEDNKDKGAYYTPKPVVHYMTQESLIEYLLTHLSKEFTVYKELGNNQVEFFGNEHKTGQLSFEEKEGANTLNKKDVEIIVRNKDISKLTDNQFNRLDQLLDSVKICDPAIGSGAFPMGLLQEIFTIKELIAHEKGFDVWSPAKVKESIIQNSVYGVDIEQGAVDIARLRFWLSLVVDEEKPKPLPNLDYKIVVGDSLVSKFENEFIEIDWNTDNKNGDVFDQKFLDEKKKLLNSIVEKQKLFFLPQKKIKKKISAEIRNIKIDLLINQLESITNLNGVEITAATTAKKRKQLLEKKLKLEIQKQTLQKLKELKKYPEKPFKHFDWKLDFPGIMNPAIVGNNLGFDIVIGNPPYVDSEKMTKIMKQFREYCVKKFVTTKGNWDLYIPFLELGKNLLSPTGVLSYITPNKWLSIGYGKDIRNYLYNEMYKICRCDKISVFEAGNSPVITFFKKNYKLNIISIDEFMELSEIKFIANLTKNEKIEKNFGVLLSNNINLLKKIQWNSKTIKTNFVVENPFTTGEAYKIKDILLSNKIFKNSFKFINTGTIDPYCNLWGKKKTTYLKDKYEHPIIKSLEFKNKFPKRFIQTSKAKIIITGMRYFEAFLDETGVYIAGKSTIIISKKNENSTSLKFLLAILNSKLISFYIKQNYSALGIDGGINFNKPMVEDIPLPNVSKSKIKTIIKLVDKIILIKAENPETDKSELENRIDELVYELYKLTSKEIKIVENK